MNAKRSFEIFAAGGDFDICSAAHDQIWVSSPILWESDLGRELSALGWFKEGFPMRDGDDDEDPEWVYDAESDAYEAWSHFV